MVQIGIGTGRAARLFNALITFTDFSEPSPRGVRVIRIVQRKIAWRWGD
jgi:hypothetical protein